MSATLLHLSHSPYLAAKDRAIFSHRDNVELDFLAMAMEAEVEVTVHAAESLVLALEKLDLHLSLDEQALRPH